MKSIMKKSGSWVAGGIGMCLVASSCASVHPGNIADPETHNSHVALKISAELGGDQHDQGYALVYITFENTGDRWVKIAESNVNIAPADADKVSVIVGKDLEDWATAVQTTNELKKHNKGILESGLLIAGGITALATGGRHSAAASVANDVALATVAGTGTYMIADGLISGKQKAERPSWVPDKHLYQPFSVPAKLFVRKWVVLNKPASFDIHTLNFQIKTVEGDTETYEVHI